MANPPPTTHATIAYQPADTATSEAVKTPIVRLSVGGSPMSEDLGQLLHRRLRFCALLGFVSTALGLASSFLIDPKQFSSVATLFTKAPCQGLAIINVVVLGLLCVALWQRKSISLSSLRWMELVGFGTWIAGLFWNDALSTVEYLPDLRVGINRSTYSNASVQPVVTFIVLYGIFIPNTARRCAAVTGIVVALFVLRDAWILLTGEVPLQHAARYLTNLTIILVGMLAIVIYGAHRLSIMRQQAIDARKLGQYTLRESLGAGGMGEVYRAEHALLRRPCAVKLIRPDKAADPAALARFEREVQATAALAHPHVVRIHDYGRADDGTFYCVMEFLPGVTLDALVKRHGRLPPGRAVFLLRQLCAALAEAHAAGLTHRDVKPGNVIVRDASRQADFATLLDFGLVMDRSAGDDKLTAHGTVTGTPSFMAPEQAAGDPVDSRADVYAVGAVGYFLLAGRAPFAAGSVMRTIAAVLTEPPPPLDGVPADLAAVLLRCLAKAPGDRFASADELDAALAGCGGDGWSHDHAAAWWRATVGPTPPTDPAATRSFADPAALADPTRTGGG